MGLVWRTLHEPSGRRDPASFQSGAGCAAVVIPR